MGVSRPISIPHNLATYYPCPYHCPGKSWTCNSIMTILNSYTRLYMFIRSIGYNGSTHLSHEQFRHCCQHCWYQNRRRWSSHTGEFSSASKREKDSIHNLTQVWVKVTGTNSAWVSGNLEVQKWNYVPTEMCGSNYCINQKWNQYKQCTPGPWLSDKTYSESIQSHGWHYVLLVDQNVLMQWSHWLPFKWCTAMEVTVQ